MAIIFNETDHKSELQRRITSELREKQKSKSLADSDLAAPEYSNEDSAYLQQTKTTTSLAWAWALIAAAVVGVIVTILVVISG
jgi:F0F1-type ATP synthase assembly protein I